MLRLLSFQTSKIRASTISSFKTLRSFRATPIVRHQMTTNQEAPASPRPASPPKLRFADVGINLSDPIFRGIHHDKQAHEDDLDDVVQRALDVGCCKMMVTGSDLQVSREAVELAKRYPATCFATIGVHPCNANVFDTHPGGADALLSDLRTLALKSREAGLSVAFGEIGLDYDRLFLAEKEQQLRCFERQLELAVELQMPLFLHSRAASEDFERILGQRLPSLPKRGLVHSFTGTVEEMQRLVDMGFHVGVNGCSMKTEENLEVVKAIPLERIQIETDGPWCEMRPSHASAAHKKDAPPLPKSVKKERFEKGLTVKGRNEPVAIVHIAYAVASVKGISVQELCQAAWDNSIRMFGLGETVT